MNSDVLVVGAGAFGGWTALSLQELSLNVLLVDAWVPGNIRSSSGGETRIVRASYGSDALFTTWGQQGLDRWQQRQQEWNTSLYVRTGLLLLSQDGAGFAADSFAELTRQGIEVERLDRNEVSRRFPAMSVDEGLAVFEPRAGVVMARKACMRVADAFERAGGQVRWNTSILPLPLSNRSLNAAGRTLSSVRTLDGTILSASSFVLAAGPWLPALLPSVMASRMRVTRQDVMFFGVPAGDPRFRPPLLPVWVDEPSPFYGVPCIDGRGFKTASHLPGPPFDPDTGERSIDPDSLRAARDHLRKRFPDLADAPLVETRVCQYEWVEDESFIIDRHPDFDNVWIVGGGSGHGFKHGPVVGEYVARQIAEGSPEPPIERFRLGRTITPGSLHWLHLPHSPGRPAPHSPGRDALPHSPERDELELP